MLNKLKRILGNNELVKHEITRRNTNLRYYRDEIATYRNKRELVQFVFEHAYLMDSDWQSFYFTYLQASYLIPDKELEKTAYLRFLFVEDSIENFFYINEEKWKALFGQEDFNDLIRLEEAPSLTFEDDGIIEFTQEFDDYKNKIKAAIKSHGFEKLIYTYDDFKNPDVAINTDFPIFNDEDIFPELWAYVEKLIPELDEVRNYNELYPSLLTAMENLLWELDSQHTLKVHYMKNLRLVTPKYFVGMETTLRQKRTQLALSNPILFKQYKR